MAAPDPAALSVTRDRLRAEHLRPPSERPASSARGLHHTALVSGDVERTIRFYQGVLELPLTELVDNRDYPGSSQQWFSWIHIDDWLRVVRWSLDGSSLDPDVAVPRPHQEVTWSAATDSDEPTCLVAGSPEWSTACGSAW